MLQCMSSYDNKDSTSSRKTIPDFSSYSDINLKGKKKIGLPKEYMIEGLNPEIESTWNQALDWFKKRCKCC